MVLVLSFIDVMYYIDCFADIEVVLHPTYKSHFVVVNNSFNVLLDPVDYYLVENFCIHGHQGNWSVVVLFSQALGLEWKLSFHFYIWNSFKRISVNSSLNV